jgi:hypothetical protein
MKGIMLSAGKYKRECDDKGFDFVPFVMTTDGALEPAAQKLVRTLAKILSEKWRMAEGAVRGWIKARLAMAIARASSACIRGCRTQPHGAEQELEADFGDGAGLDRILDSGNGVDGSQAQR